MNINRSLIIGTALTGALTGIELGLYRRRNRAISKDNREIIQKIEKQTPVFVAKTYPLPKANWLVPGRMTTLYDRYQKIKKQIRTAKNPIIRTGLNIEKKYLEKRWGLNRVKMTPWDKYKDWRSGSIVIDPRITKSSVFPLLRSYEEGMLNRKTRGLSYLPEIGMGIGTATSILGVIKKKSSLKRIGTLIAAASGIGKVGKDIYLTEKSLQRIKKIKHPDWQNELTLAAANMVSSVTNPILKVIEA